MLIPPVRRRRNEQGRSPSNMPARQWTSCVKRPRWVTATVCTWTVIRTWTRCVAAPIIKRTVRNWTNAIRVRRSPLPGSCNFWSKRCRKSRRSTAVPRTTVAETRSLRTQTPSLPGFVDKYLAFADSHRLSPEAITALLWVMETTSHYRSQPAITKQREKALAMFERDHLQKPEFLQVCQKLGEDPTVDCQSLLRAAVTKHSERDSAPPPASSWPTPWPRKRRTNTPRTCSGAELAYQAEQQLEQLLKDYPEVVVGSTTMRETAQDKLFRCGISPSAAPLRRLPGTTWRASRSSSATTAARSW